MEWETDKAIAQSLPVRERGLKLTADAGKLEKLRSLPVRERGLKRDHAARALRLCVVAPRAGAWIEASLLTWAFFLCASLPVRERGLKPHAAQVVIIEIMSLPVRERGLKLCIAEPRHRCTMSLPVRERGLKRGAP